MKFSGVFAAVLLVLCLPSLAAPTDIVPRGDTLNDAFASLARRGLLTEQISPADFLGEPLHTRAELAQILEKRLLAEGERFSRARSEPDTAAALRAALVSLQPELLADGVDVPALLAEIRPAPLALGGVLQPEIRLQSGGDPDPPSGAIGIYRVTALGDLGAQVRYGLSASNWPEDWRRRFDNDLGPHDFSGLNAAYLEFHDRRGLTVTLGRFYDRWGPGYRGATLLSDNAPAFDQIRLAFPFSLGRHFGRNYRFTQMLATFRENDIRIYYEARRIEYAFNSHWNADFQEEFKSSNSHALYVSVFPDFYSGQQANLRPTNIKIGGLDQHFNAAMNFGLSYTAGAPLRIYGQFLIDDLRTPGRSSGVTPRKIAYLIGTAFRPSRSTSVVAEYTFADPTTYSSRDIDTQLQKGQFMEIGLPGGPNTREEFVRLSQQVTPRLSLAVQVRDRRRRDDSFPAPTARALGAFAVYNLNAQNSLGVSFYDYRQDPFPLAPGAPVGNGFQPTAQEGNYGQRLRLRQLDLSYQFFF